MIQSLYRAIGSIFTKQKQSPVHFQNSIHTKLPNGAIYTGKIVNGKLEGLGTLVYENSQRYEGQFLNGMKHGKGKYYYIRGQLYIGDWFQNKKHGKGQYFYQNGQRYCGQFRNNMKHGKGFLIEEDGSQFRGQFYENKKNGQGEYFDAIENKTYRQWYQHGKLVTRELKIQEQKYEESDKKIDSTNKKQRQSQQSRDSMQIKSLADKIKSDQFSEAMSGKEVFSLMPKINQIHIPSSSKIANPYNSKDQKKFKTIKFLPINKKIITWSIEDVSVWLQNLGLSEYIRRFEKQKISGDILINIKQNELKQIGVGIVGDRKWLIKQIQMLNLIFKKQSIQDFPQVRSLNYANIGIEEIQNLKFESSNRVQEAQIAKNDVEDDSSSTSSEQQQKRKSIQSLKKKQSTYTNNNKNIEKKVQQYLRIHGIKLNFLIPKDQIQIIRPIGKGGYGQVFLGRWLGQQVAVKRYMKKRGLRNRHIGNFIEQVQLINKLLHPSIVLYMGMCIYDNIYAMITEFLSNGSLFDYLHKKNQTLVQQKIFYIVKDIALGMTYLHGKNVLHCDLKSSNVLIDENWNVKLCDFGLSRLSSSKKREVSRVGTPHWMAPQILRGQKYLFESDVYSFGILIWEMLTGKIPYFKFSTAQIIGLVGRDQNHKIEVPKSENKLMVQLFQKCTARDPQKRPSFAQIVQFLQLHQSKYIRLF